MSSSNLVKDFDPIPDKLALKRSSSFDKMKRLFKKKHTHGQIQLQKPNSVGHHLSVPNNDNNNHYIKRNSGIRSQIAPKKVSKIVEWFEKIKDNKASPVNIDLKIDISSINMNSKPKIKSWKPSLKYIFKDNILLTKLITFMKRSYNEENILFLQSVRQLHKTIDIDQKMNNYNDINDINQQIISIYNNYIIPTSKYQINLSYDCFKQIIGKRDEFLNYSIKQKRNLFSLCVGEIERLMLSVLCGFYSTAEFKEIAAKRTINSIDDSPSTPPILISLSHSPTVTFEVAEYDDEEMIVYAK